MSRDVVVENLAGSDLHDDENVEGPEGGGDHHEEVTGHMTLAWYRATVSQRCFGSGVRTGPSLTIEF
jgi:hypothetical protein